MNAWMCGQMHLCNRLKNDQWVQWEFCFVLKHGLIQNPKLALNSVIGLPSLSRAGVPGMSCQPVGLLQVSFWHVLVLLCAPVYSQHIFTQTYPMSRSKQPSKGQWFPGGAASAMPCICSVCTDCLPGYGTKNGGDGMTHGRTTEGPENTRETPKKSDEKWGHGWFYLYNMFHKLQRQRQVSDCWARRVGWSKVASGMCHSSDGNILTWAMMAAGPRHRKSCDSSWSCGLLIRSQQSCYRTSRPPKRKKECW